MENTSPISNIKADLEGRLGENILVVAQAGRKKITRQHGILKSTFPAVFIVELDQNENSYERVSYNYTDVLTGIIQLKFGQDIIDDEILMQEKQKDDLK